MLNGFDEVMRDDKGKLMLEPAKVRGRATPEGKAKSVPFTLVEKYPWQAIQYDWVSEKHKQVAKMILSGIDPTDTDGRKFPVITYWRDVLISEKAKPCGGRF